MISPSTQLVLKQRQNYMLPNFVTNYDDLGRNSIEKMIEQVEQPVDYLEKEESRGILSKIAFYLNLANPDEWIFFSFLRSMHFFIFNFTR